MMKLVAPENRYPTNRKDTRNVGKPGQRDSRIGGAGDYFESADLVVQLDSYRVIAPTTRRIAAESDRVVRCGRELRMPDGASAAGPLV